MRCKAIKIKWIRIVAIAALLWVAPACSKDDPESSRGSNSGNTEIPETPGTSEPADSTSTGYDFSAELLNDTTRVYGPRFKLVYGEPGVMASTTADGSVTLRSIVTGRWITFNDGKPKSTVCGPRMEASIEVNGEAVAIDTCALEAATAQGRWWSLVLHGDTTYTALVITDL
ncbi:MAG: hypothetical protein LIP02_02430 [Bacteroidales bacterium]|nr:hypothetical protein [Bacteroidales bacterium]